ncbi:MAG: HlyC/CorC family transporter [Alphaproteobacteria bacterium]|nr:HlyC/CorC family transporter [Alphaproteobacteria bacterium]
MLTTIIAIFVLLLLSAFFSGAETALTATSRPLMHQLEQEGNRRAALVNRLVARREQLIGSILLGNNVANILSSALATSLLVTAFGDAGVAYATLVMTVFILIFSEILPKTFALRHANATALAVAPSASLLVKVLSLPVKVVQAVVRLSLRLLGADKTREYDAAAVMTELRGVIDLHDAREVKDERAMLRSVLDLADVTVGEIMTHRKSVESIDGGQPATVVVDAVLNSPYTRIPLWREKPDNVIGVVHAKALLRAVRAHEGDLDRLDVAAVASPPWFVPDSTTLQEQLQAFRDRREHFAMVVDEYGTIMGVVTLEDILEEIVGDITDEHDVAVSGVRPQPDGSYVVDGSVTLRDLNREFDWKLPDEEAATIAGLVLHEARRIPEIGQIFRFHGFRFEILRRQRNQIISVRMTPLEDDETS